MDIFNALTMIGGLCLFLFGMNIMGQALERRAGNELKFFLGKLTTNKWAGLLTGLGVTAVVQSSSATTVMVVGFVNSRLMTLKQAINVIMGANIGTTVTAWILSLSGIESDNIFVSLLKPSSFTPLLALYGIIVYMFSKSNTKRDTGTILLGFATLMFGMETMSDAVSGLADIPAFRNLFILFKNPILGVLAGAVLTAVIQSSSASVGVLQALSATGQISFGAAIPIIMGQNIGTCVTAMISSVGANKNAKRAAFVHLSFNVIGTAVWLAVFCAITAVFKPGILDGATTHLGIAVAHSAFNILCTVLMLTLSSFLERLANRIIPDSKSPESISELDDRLLNTPSIALERCNRVAVKMAEASVSAIKSAISSLKNYSDELAEKVAEGEEQSDHYEDILGTYLVKLSSYQISETDSAEAAKLLKIIGDIERISDHAVNILESAQEIREKEITFSKTANEEIEIICDAVNEIIDLSLASFLDNDLTASASVESLEHVIDRLKEQLRTRHILRLQQGGCSIDAGFVWSDLLTNLERVSDHCSNIAGCVLDVAENKMNLHESLRAVKANNPEYEKKCIEYTEKYALPQM